MATTPVNNKKQQAIVSSKDLNLILRILKSNWWVPVVILPLFYAAGRFYVYRLTTVYKASTEFLLKSDDTYYKSNVLNEANFYANSYMDNSNETRILQSYDLSGKVVDKLMDKLQVSYFIVGKVRVTEQFSGMPFTILVNSVNPADYERTYNFRILDYNRYEISYEENGAEQLKTGQFDKPLIDLEWSLQINRSNNFTEKTAEHLKAMLYQFVIHSREYLIASVRENLSVENPEFTQILRVSLKDVVPERAVLILDTLNTVYAQNKLQSKFEMNERTVEYIDRQLNEITYSLKNIEDTMQNYKQRKAIINLDWQQTDFLTKISSFDAQRSQTELQLRALNDLEKYIIEDKDPQFLPPSVFVSEKSGFMATATTDLYNKQIELNRLYGVAKENNPAITDLKAGIKKTKQDLLIYINNTRKATNLQIESLNKAILDYINEAKLIPGKQREVLNIQRQAAVSEQLYNFLLEKKASTKIARAGIVPDLKIVEAPRYGGIDSPDKSKIEKQFLSIGLLISAIIILIRTFFFEKITSVDYLKDLTSLPLIGVLPQVKVQESDAIIVDQAPNSLISESFRNFRTNLQYANVDNKDARSYLITSFLPGEGKTFTSVNLATILARSGKRTVIIELDLHKPRIYKRFGLPAQSKGLTTYLSGQNSYEEIISPTHIENLFCIYSGPIPPNPSEFVLSEKMKETIDRAKAEFDYVIIDTPPAGLLSDSIYLMQYVDSTIFVLNTRSSTKKVITFIENLMIDNKINNILLVLNGVKRIKKRYYYQGYGYSYGYGYGYGYGKGYGYKK